MAPKRQQSEHLGSLGINSILHARA